MLFILFFFKQKTAYDMRISDWSSDVCSSDLDNDQSLDTVSHHPLQPQCGAQQRVAVQMQAKFFGVQRKRVVVERCIVPVMQDADLESREFAPLDRKSVV